MPVSPDLEARFRRGLAELGLGGARVVVALSGGADSVALLHLLRRAAGEEGIELTAAHLDHALRRESAADAEWVRGLCRAWEVPLVAERLAQAPRGEAAARAARYAFLRRVAAEAGASRIATGHHADDQAETVLFRALRGTGPAGLAGIAPDSDGIVRPLLPFTRRELRRYLRERRARWRQDPSNAAPGPRRNAVRHRLLPLAERAVAPGATRALARLADLAREDEAAWRAVLRPLREAAAREDEGGLVLVRGVVAGYDSAVAARLLRDLLRPLGVVLDRAGTRLALEFITSAPSGRELLLPGGVRIRTEFGAARIERPSGTSLPDAPLAVFPEGDGSAGEGAATIGGLPRRVRWRVGPWSGRDAPAAGPEAAFALRDLRTPLTVRGWIAGDRIRTRGGTKPLKKLFGEARVPRAARARVPVVADADGTLVWVAGIAQAPSTVPRAGERALFLAMVDGS